MEDSILLEGLFVLELTPDQINLSSASRAPDLLTDPLLYLTPPALLACIPFLYGANNQFDIDPTYVSNTPIVSSATFNGRTLAGLGFTTTGLIGTWTLNGTSETIDVVIGAPSAAVPGPLPLLGAGAAFGWSRRLRKRIAAPLSTLPQA